MHKQFVFLCTKTVDNFVDESTEWMLQPQYCRHFRGVAQKTHCKKHIKNSMML